MEYHDPLNASLVLPFQRPRDGRSTLPILPSLPQLGLLRCREPNPRRHHGTPPSPRKIRRCCADRLNPPPESGHPISASTSTNYLSIGFAKRARVGAQQGATFEADHLVWGGPLSPSKRTWAIASISPVQAARLSCGAVVCIAHDGEPVDRGARSRGDG